MKFGLEFFLLSLVLSCSSICHSWIQKYPQTSPVFTLNEEYFWDFPTTTLDDFSLGYQPVTLQDDGALVYRKILENQFIAYSIISELESNLPCELRSSRSSFCNNVLPKEVYFADYPHDKALLEYHWKRPKNALDGNRLGSLRVDSSFYRP